MASETDLGDEFPASVAEALRNFPLIVPLMLGAESHHQRVVLMNPLSRTMVVMESESSADMLQKSGRRPASKASIDALPTVEVANGDEQCAICLEGWQTAKELPCKHRFHGACVERWLTVNGSCPVCRYQMPQPQPAEDNHLDERESMMTGVFMTVAFAFDFDAVSTSNSN